MPGPFPAPPSSQGKGPGDEVGLTGTTPSVANVTEHRDLGFKAEIRIKEVKIIRPKL